ncbi:hypothetical protein DHEL01_v202237 [Diaporthe helianthi]|uniref:3-carboxymuconate cyclase n=1 Tax=Diaporthe helianthi TaxID=158607 RepID=A0A2P5IA17_DIAHE|nr:hypothetical protein DHEL01_v202237 [Diaporthe helianthi]
MYISTFVSLLALASSAIQVSARPARSCGSKGCAAKVTNGKAVYMLSNQASNTVVAVPIAQDGTLNEAGGSSTTTGGAGATGIDGSTNAPSNPDALFSQSALTVAGNNLFAVNAGSNTLSMFTIDAQDPTKLTMVGQPAQLPGEFPVTVGASAKHNIACAGMTGSTAGISCASFNAEQGLGAMDDLRPFDLGQSTPPVGPTNTVSQVFFSDDQATMFATVKGDPTKNNTGFLASFPVNAASRCQSASVAAQGEQSSPEGTAVLFGSAAIPGTSDLFVTDASFGGAVLSMQQAAAAATGNGSSQAAGAAPQVVGKGVVEGQKATCWAAISPATNTAFVTDVGVNHLVEMSLEDASIQSQTDLSANGDPGLIDLKAAGNMVYALSPGNGTTNAAVTVVDATSKKQVQHLDMKALGFDANAMGMAVLE